MHTCPNEVIDTTSIIYVSFPYFKETDVELHTRPSYLRSPIADRRLFKWFAENQKEQMSHQTQIDENVMITAPTKGFNIVYLLLHAYRHVTGEGVGLRQLMDYYFVLCDKNDDDTLCRHNEELMRLIEHFGMKRFARAVMWIMKAVFGMDETYMICKPSKTDGEFLLNEILLGGNFGHYDIRLAGDTRLKRSWLQTKRNLLQLRYYPSEVLWSVPWRLKVKIINLLGK